QDGVFHLYSQLHRHMCTPLGPIQPRPAVRKRKPMPITVKKFLPPPKPSRWSAHDLQRMKWRGSDSILRGGSMRNHEDSKNTQNGVHSKISPRRRGGAECSSHAEVFDETGVFVILRITGQVLDNDLADSQ